MYENNHKEEFAEKIISIDNIQLVKGGLKVVLTTTQFGRVTQKPFNFGYGQFQRIKTGGYVCE